MRRNLRNLAAYLFLSAAVFSAGCKKENTVVYGVSDVKINKSNPSKPSVKSTVEFISIAYSDLFGTTISQKELVELGTSYASFGDLKLIEDLIIRNFLNKPGAQFPGDQEMRADIPKFIKNSYNKLFNRDPNEFELWQLQKRISEDAEITPEVVWYAMMTSNEYRYY